MKKLWIPFFAILLIGMLAITTLATDVAFVDVAGRDANDGLTADTAKQSPAAAFELLKDGGTMVVSGKSYMSRSTTFAKTAAPVTVTSVYDGVDYKNAVPASNPACAFKGANAVVWTIEGDIILDDIILFQESVQNSIVVKSGGSLTVTDSVICMSNYPYYWKITVEEGATATINGGIFSNVTGAGNITVAENVRLTDLDPMESQYSYMFVNFAGTQSNDGQSADTPKQTMNLALGALSSGGTVIVSGKGFFSGSYTSPKTLAPITITSGYLGHDYKNPEPAENPAGALKISSGATWTILGDIILDDIILFQEASQNTVLVKSGASLTVNENVICMMQKDYHWRIVVEAGGKAVINGGTFSSIAGDGEIVIGEKATFLDGNLSAGGPQNGGKGLAFNKFGAPATNDGLTPETPRAKLGKVTDDTSTMSLVPYGGTIVTVGKTFVGVNYALPHLAGPLTFTSVWDGVNYKNPEPATNPNCAFKMAGATLTITSDLIFDNIILFQEAAQATVHVTEGATLIVTDTVDLMASTENHFRILVDKGSTAILSAKAKETFTLEGEGTFLDFGIDRTATVIEMTVGTMTGYVNGRGKVLDAAPVIRNSRTMLPVRFVAENLGATVGWDGATSTVTVSTSAVEIRITIGKAQATVNGAAVTLDSPAFIENSRTYLPVRFVAENLGATVGWDGATSTVTLTK